MTDSLAMRRTAPSGTAAYAEPALDRRNALIPGATARRRGLSTIRRAIDYIERNSTQSISLRELAAVTNLSLFRFATLFRREMGVPPHRYLCQVRIEHAKALLRDGIPPAIAASEAGFFDQSHLCRHFKNMCGLTPGQYRLKLRAPANEAGPCDWHRSAATA